MLIKFVPPETLGRYGGRQYESSTHTTDKDVARQRLREFPGQLQSGAAALGTPSGWPAAPHDPDLGLCRNSPRSGGAFLPPHFVHD